MYIHVYIISTYVSSITPIPTSAPPPPPGYYLAFFFIISHNFVGVHMFDSSNSSRPANPSFLYKQVTSSSNVGGAWLCLLNGGLNYQIEHHLFPRIQHSHYPTIAPIVKAFCAKKGIPYVHFPTVAGNMASCVQHLSNMGHKVRLSVCSLQLCAACCF